MDNIVNTSDVDIDYTLIYKDKEIILNEIGLSEKDKFITEAIVENLEEEIAIQVKAGKNVSIPFIGSIEKNWYKMEIKSKAKEFRDYKETHTREEYQEYFKTECEKIKENHNEEELKNKKVKAFKSKVLPKYIQLCKNRSVIYANAWLAMAYKLKVVEFDPDIEEVYEKFRLGLDADD